MPSKDKTYRSLADLISDALVVLQDGQYQIVNSAFTKLFGYTQHDVEGVNFFELVQDKDKQKVQRRYEDRLAGKQVPQTCTIDLFTKDGAIKPCETSATVIEYDSRPADLVLIRDISERVHTEAALRESDAEYRELFENMLEGVYKTLPDGTIIKANPALVKMLGYESEEDLCTSVKVSNLYLNPDNRLDLTHMLEKEGELRNVEINLRCKNGGKITVLENARVVRDSSGKVSYYEGILTDITERKRAEWKLQESENKFRSITENAVDFIFIKDVTRRYTFVNRAMQELLGLQEEEILGKTPEEIFGPEQGQVVKDVDDRTFSGETVDETRGLVIGNKEYFFNTLQTPLSMENGEVTSIMGIVRDITDRKRAEENLRATHEQLQATLNALPDIMFEMDYKGRILYVHAPHPELLYRPPEDFIGKRVSEVLPRHASDIVMKSVREVEHDGKSQGAMYSLAVDGEELWFELSLAAKGDLRNPECRIIALVRDITERKQAEEALMESEEKLRNIVEHSTNLFYSHTPEHELTYLSPQSRDILQCDPDEAMIRWTEFATDNLANERGFALTEKAIKTGKRQPSYELELVGKKGRIVWVEVHEAPIVEKGKTVAVVGSLTDITEQKQSVEKLKETTESLVIERQELTEKNIALKQILEHIESQTQSHRQQVCSDIEKAIIPAVTRLKKKAGLQFADEFENLETAIAVVLSKDIEEYVARYSKLTSRESEICEMIKASMSSKQIADSLNLSLPTVLKHREHARKKLGITGKNLSLSTYLRSH